MCYTGGIYALTLTWLWVFSNSITSGMALQRCADGKFGTNCQLTCHCDKRENCARSDGQCFSGCSEPWQGDTCQKRNFAVTKPAFQSSSLPSSGNTYGAIRAVDGQRKWPSCSHTNPQLGPYWTLDLVLTRTIYNIRIYNREDCCQDRLTGFRVYVSNVRDFATGTLCYAHPTWMVPGIEIDVTCSRPITGRYVTVLVNRREALTLCEVEVYECADFTYGPECLKECQCKDMFEVCDKRNGECQSGCLPGWKGENCRTACPDFTFGDNCTGRCLCQQFDEVCNKVTGECQSGCISGKGGPGCRNECASFTFGSNCDGRCQCLDKREVCNKVTGECSSGCGPGWSGTDCQTACMVGTYGLFCQGKCRCADPTEVCDNISGYCSSGCAVGWTGVSCENKCPDGKFGPGCKEKCNCYDSTEVCNTQTGSCSSGCAGESRGIGCSVCPVGRYGSLCDLRCLCRNASEQCNRETGFCKSGCLDNPNSNKCQSPLTGRAPGLAREAIGGIIGGVAAVLLVCLIGLIVCLTRKRKNKPTRANVVQYENYTPGSQEESVGFPVTETPQAALSQPATYENVERMYQNCAEVSPKKGGLPTEEMFTLVQRSLKDPEGLEEEFKNIPVPLSSTNEANKPENTQKNRYKHILPFDNNRVTLEETEEEGSDYINASYIDGYQRPKAYIATQGPTSTMITDFWRMVWQEKSGKIVMLTNLVETGRRKCDQYWPETEVKMTEDMKIEHFATEDFADFTVRNFKLTKGDDVRTVKQFHFRSWSDHAAPDETTGILHFRDKIRDTNVETEGPTIVHCSAGVGRTGTYIALDMLIEHAQKEGVLDIAGCVKRMRTQRMHMLQNPIQYEFLHKALRDAVLCTNASVTAGRFIDDVRIHTPEGKAKISQEFLVLGKFKALETRPKERNADNRHKNRSEDILAPNSHRVFLSSNIEGRNNYINAIFVPSYLKKQGLIITQTPLPDTVIDFWRLIYEQKCSSIIMLDDVTDKDERTYWPKNGLDLCVEPFTISTLEEKCQSSEIRVRTFHLKNEQESTEEAFVVKQFLLLEWPHGNVIPTSADSLLSLTEIVEDWRRECGRTETVVHCLNGAFRCGVYAAVNIILERLKSEHLVNVMQTVHQIRSIRSQFIYSPEQYTFCYDIARKFLQTFHGYQNLN